FADLDALHQMAGGEQRTLLGQVPALVKTYDDEFQKLAAAYREKGHKDWGIEGEWRKAIHDVEDHLPQARSDSLRIDYLQLRRDEKDYLLRGEPQYAQAVRTDLNKLAAVIRANPESAQLLRDLQLYDQLFQKYQDVESKIG